MSIDTDALKERVDLVELAGADVQLRRVATAEYAGPCPRCGGSDRLHVTPEWFFCRQCHEKRGDAIEYVQWRDDLTFREACDALGGAETALEAPGLSGQAPTRVKPAMQERPTAPGAVWQERARAFCAWAQGQLWKNESALAYLRGRGLTDETIRAAGLGYSAMEMKDTAARWGVDDARPVMLPRGWVIPAEVAGILRYVKIRRLDKDIATTKGRGRPLAKYHAVKGSIISGTVYGLDDLRGCSDALLCEGEFDALVLRQEVAGVAGVAALPGVGGSAGAEALAVLMTVPRIWVAFDADDAGEMARARWGGLSARVRALVPPAHDINAAHLAGHDLADWAVLRIGPRGNGRAAWAEHHLMRLGDAAFEAGTYDASPALRAWLALERELRAEMGLVAA